MADRWAALGMFRAAFANPKRHIQARNALRPPESKMARRNGKQQSVGPERILPALLPFAVPIDSLKLDPDNEREHGAENLASIRNSFQMFGQQLPCLHDKKRVVKVGNGRLTVARELGWKRIASIPTDLVGLDAAAYRMLDNRSAELAPWIWPQLQATQERLAESDADLMNYGFTPEQNKQIEAEWSMAQESPPEPKDADVDIDRAVELQHKWKVQAGEVIEIGRHRLACDDFTSGSAATG